MSDAVDVEFIETRLVPAARKCHCPGCRVTIESGNYCDDCLATCVVAIKRLHKARPTIASMQRTAGEIRDGVRAVADVAGVVGEIFGAVSGKPRRRRR